MEDRVKVTGDVRSLRIAEGKSFCTLKRKQLVFFVLREFLGQEDCIWGSIWLVHCLKTQVYQWQQMHTGRRRWSFLHNLYLSMASPLQWSTLCFLLLSAKRNHYWLLSGLFSLWRFATRDGTLPSPSGRELETEYRADAPLPVCADMRHLVWRIR